MRKKVVEVDVIESERGWGSKVDDQMICLSVEDAYAFTEEFNARNDKDVVPDWYMRAEGKPRPTSITEKQYKELELSEHKRCWWSKLRNI